MRSHLCGLHPNSLGIHVGNCFLGWVGSPRFLFLVYFGFLGSVLDFVMFWNLCGWGVAGGWGAGLVGVSVGGWVSWAG